MISVDVINKCCDEGLSYNLSSVCSLANSSFTADLCRDRTNCSIKISPIDCSDGKYRLADGDVWTLTNNGLQVEGFTSPRTVYCLELFEDTGTVYPVVCHTPPASVKSVDDSPFVAFGFTYLLSFILVLTTFIIYTAVFNLRSAQRYCNVNYFAALSLAMLSISVVQLLTSDLPDNLCTSLGFAVQFFFLATFFWLNVMCIDICWAFSGFKLLRGSALERDRKKLLFYSLYAWGMPLLILTITVGVDYSDAIPASSLFKPGIGTEKCFFKGRVATWVYFYGPMGVVILCNAVLYTVTAIRLCRHRRETAVLKRGDSRKHDGNDKERFNLYLKLFLVMGINWVSELVSYMFGNEVPKYMWYATDITNTLQGLFIFLIFVWKKRVRRLVWNKLCKSRSQSNGGPRGSIQTTNTASNSSSTPSNSIKLNQVFFSCCFDTKADKEENKTPQKSFELPTLSVDILRKDSEQNGYYKKMEVLTMENIQALLCAF